jgi:phosphatidylglycerophosphate synthase
MPTWLVVMVVARDVFILLGFVVIFYQIGERLKAEPTVIGKCSTMLQLVTLAAALTSLHNPRWVPPLFLSILITGTAAATMISGVQYLYRGFVWLQDRTPLTPSKD